MKDVIPPQHSSESELEQGMDSFFKLRPIWMILRPGTCSERLSERAQIVASSSWSHAFHTWWQNLPVNNRCRLCWFSLSQHKGVRVDLEHQPIFKIRNCTVNYIARVTSQISSSLAPRTARAKMFTNKRLVLILYHQQCTAGTIQLWREGLCCIKNESPPGSSTKQATTEHAEPYNLYFCLGPRYSRFGVS